jgi:predicted lipoprotein with Yx(FWY)xxD motif
MQMLKSTRTLLAGGTIVAAALLGAAACGSSGSSPKAAPAPPKTSTGASATIGVTNTSLGSVLVDAQGRTLYLFQKDTGPTSTCTGACATNWPPLVASGAPVTGSGATASLIGTTKRADGTSQVTYNGHPVYLFVGDHSPGDTNGQGVVAFGASWFAVTAAGTPVSGSGTAPSAGGGNGSGY